MKVTVTAPPKILTSFFVTPAKIVANEKIMEYARRMKEFIFGRETMYCAKLMELDIYNLVFIKNIPFREYVAKKIIDIEKSKKENVMTALLINALYRGKPVRLVTLHRSGESIVVGEPVPLRLSIIDTSADYNKVNRRLAKKEEKLLEIPAELNKSGEHYLETVRMAVVKYYMKKSINEKEFMDKINYRRFSTNLRLNNRPATVSDINMLLNKRRNMTFIDLTEASSRIYLSALYMLTYKDFTFKELYDSEKVFSGENGKADIYSAAASEFINIIYNGNGIEISDVLVKMAESFAKIKLPEIEPGNLVHLMDNFKEIYVIAAVAYRFEKAFTEHEMLKKNMRRKMVRNYWTFYSNILQFKKFGSVVSFCYNLADVDLKKYRDDTAYADDLLLKFAEAERVIKEIKKEVNEL